MSDLQDYEADFEKLIKEIETCITVQCKDKKRINSNSVIEIKNKLTRANQILKSYRIDFRELPKLKQQQYQTKANEFEQRIKTLENELNWVEDINYTNINTSGEDKQYKDTITKANKIQKQDLDSTNKLLLKINKMNDQGISTLQEMNNQQNKMEQINKSMNEIDSNLNLADRHVKSLSRKM